jgi:hypothetical protein
MRMNRKSEIRNSRSEGSWRREGFSGPASAVSIIRISLLEFVSNFEFRISDFLTLLLLATTLAGTARAQSAACACAGVQGPVEIRHADAWQPAGVGGAITAGDHVRTAEQSRATIVCGDDAVLDLAPHTELAINTGEGREPGPRLLVRLASGKIRVWAGSSSEGAARYEVETPTAVVVVRGTEFIVSYDGPIETTEVVGLAGHVEVRAKSPGGSGLDVGPHFFTRVAKGRSPVRTQRVSAMRLSQYLDGVDLVGTGRRDGLNVLHPAVAGHLLAPQDVPGPAEAGEDGREATRALAVHAPLPGSVADRLSPDVYTNTQPLRDYQHTPPGQVPPQ